MRGGPVTYNNCGVISLNETSTVGKFDFAIIEQHARVIVDTGGVFPSTRDKVVKA
jgi:hypothetical protein